MDLEVTTVSRAPVPQSLVPAAIHVITRDEIRRSGARTLIDVLRLAPGVHVAQIDANTWAIGIRGFTDRLAKSMLVLIDGRAVYSPLFAGTYWEVQDYLLEDIERVEVIRGPGGTLWGANAVNGIVNIITRSAAATQGVVTEGAAGAEERAVSMRAGTSRGDAAYRIYGKFADRSPAFHTDGTRFDAWRMGQAGFRADWGGGESRSTLQGDIYAGVLGQRIGVTTYTPPFLQVAEEDGDVSGANLLARVTRQLGAQRVSLQAYYDRTRRRDSTLEEVRNTVDLDLQSVVNVRRHSLVWGAGVRVTADDTTSVQTVFFTPEDRRDVLVSGFVQDGVSLIPDRLVATLGVKIEHNDYSGVELQPSARLTWAPTPAQTIVGSVTRAVRTPSRAEHGLNLTNAVAPPVFLRLMANDAFRSEELVAYEIGHRFRAAERVAISSSLFLNQHDDLVSTLVGDIFIEGEEPLLRAILPITFGNGLHGRSYGGEVVVDARLAPWWRWRASYSFLRMELTPDGPGTDASQEAIGEGSSPRHQLEAHASLNLPHRIELDWVFRYVSALPQVDVARYATSDLRFGWQVHPRLEAAVVGRNLHRAHHFEFSSGASGIQIERSVLATITWRR